VGRPINCTTLVGEGQAQNHNIWGCPGRSHHNILWQRRSCGRGAPSTLGRVPSTFGGRVSTRRGRVVHRRLGGCAQNICSIVDDPATGRSGRERGPGARAFGSEPDSSGVPPALGAGRTNERSARRPGRSSPGASRPGPLRGTLRAVSAPAGPSRARWGARRPRGSGRRTGDPRPPRVAMDRSSVPALDAANREKRAQSAPMRGAERDESRTWAGSATRDRDQRQARLTTTGTGPGTGTRPTIDLVDGRSRGGGPAADVWAGPSGRARTPAAGTARRRPAPPGDLATWRGALHGASSCADPGSAPTIDPSIAPSTIRTACRT